MFGRKRFISWQTWLSYLNVAATTFPITYCLNRSSESLMLPLAASVRLPDAATRGCESDLVISTSICVDLVDPWLSGWPVSGIRWSLWSLSKKRCCVVGSAGVVPGHQRGDWRGLPVSPQKHRCMHSALPERPVEYVRGIDCASRPVRCKIQEMHAVWWLSRV